MKNVKHSGEYLSEKITSSSYLYIPKAPNTQHCSINRMYTLPIFVCQSYFLQPLEFFKTLFWSPVSLGMPCYCYCRHYLHGRRGFWETGWREALEDLEEVSPREALHLEGRQEDSELKGMSEILMCESLKAEMALEGGEIPSRLKHYDEHSQRKAS